MIRYSKEDLRTFADAVNNFGDAIGPFVSVIENKRHDPALLNAMYPALDEPFRRCWASFGALTQHPAFDDDDIVRLFNHMKTAYHVLKDELTLSYDERYDGVMTLADDQKELAFSLARLLEEIDAGFPIYS